MPRCPLGLLLAELFVNLLLQQREVLIVLVGGSSLDVPLGVRKQPLGLGNLAKSSVVVPQLDEALGPEAADLHTDFVYFVGINDVQVHDALFELFQGKLSQC